MQPSFRKGALAFGFRSALALCLFLNWPGLARADVTLTNNSLSAFTSALANGGVINLAFNGTINATGTFSVHTYTILNAAGYNVTISGSGSNRLFTISSSATLFATNVIFANGASIGTTGANGSPGQNNYSSNGGNGSNGGTGGAGQGGAIYNQGYGYLVGCSFLTNTVIGGNGGNGGAGGNSTVLYGGDGGNGGNGGVGYGGAIYNANVLVLSNCTFSANVVSGGNGGIGGTNGSPQSGNNDVYPGDGGVGGTAGGAALYSASGANTTVYGCTFYENGGGGGNTQTKGGGYSYCNGLTGNTGGSGTGGALCNAGTNVVINCTFYNNLIQGGVGGNGESMNPTCSYGEYGGSGGNGGSGLGGNVYNSGVIGITNCTFASGAVYGGSGGLLGYGIYTNGNNGATGTASGANIYNVSGTLKLKNSIVGYPVNDSNVGGSITDQGNNISSDGTPAFTQTNSSKNLNLQLEALANYGGPTLTMALSDSSPALTSGDPAAAPPQDQRGYWWGTAPSSGAYDALALPFPVIDMYALGPSASEDGDVGLFYFTRSSYGGPGPVTINFTISGTATNGVNYSAISNSVTIPAGSATASILIQAIPGSFAGTNLSVAVSLVTNAAYYLDTTNTTGTIELYPRSTSNPAQRFVRGTSTAPDFQSFVIPLSAESGVPLAATGGNATNLFPGNPWTTNFYHYNATNVNDQPGTNGRIVFQNPIVAFGDPVGGSPLYLNQDYQFGISSGTIVANPSNALRIQVYYRSNSAFAGTISMPILSMYNAAQLSTLASNGFTQSFTGFGLQTTVLVSDFGDWGLEFGNYFILTHSAAATATNYYYVVEEQGYGPNDWMVRNQAGNPDWSKLYVMEFTPFPAGRSTFVVQPQFNSVPLPPTYQGMSLQELTNVAPTLPNLSALVPSNYLTIDGSPELRRHPILDQFVKNMNNDPLALANYVINEVDLTDAIDYDTNYNSQPAVNLGGLNRGALATFQEGQGSPAEQCALLIYLLRQAGVPAAYVYPTNNGLQMLDFQMSKLLRVQLHGALSETGQTNMPQLISVNYPWVAAYIGTNWVQIFPWLKDTEIVEGLNLYDYMPTNYNSGYLWLNHFIANDTNIFSLSSTSDQPLDLLPLFIQKNLDANYPGISVDDLGVKMVNRRHLYASWNQFPLPFALSGPPTIMESLGAHTNLFNTLEIRVYSQANTNKSIDTTEIPALYFHGRKLQLKFVQITGQNAHTMHLSLEPYSTNITSSGTFTSTFDPVWSLDSSSTLNTNDDNIVFQVTHRRNKFLPANYVAAGFQQYTNFWDYTYTEEGAAGTGQTYVTTNLFRKGDWVAFCLDAGRVSQAMLNVPVQTIWQYNQTATTNNANPDIYVGTVAYLMGISYFNYCDRFNAFNDPLHKLQRQTSFEYGFGLIRPQRTAGGALVNNGQVVPITPALHMPDNGIGTIFNYSFRPDLGRDYYSAENDWLLQMEVQGSAAEHGVLRSFCQTNAISAIKLLQQVGTNAVRLNALNYQAAATNVYHGVQLQYADTTFWATLTSFFSSNPYNSQAIITPGVVTNGTYVGTGGLLLSQSLVVSPVGGFNGGYANNFPTTTLSQANSPNITIVPAPDGATSPYILQTGPTTSTPVDGQSTADSLSVTYNNIVNGTQTVDLNLQQAATSDSILYGTANTAAAGFNQSYNVGTFNTSVPTYSDGQQYVLEPVNAMSGEFYIDTVDLSLPGPLNLQVRRNYGSQNQAENQFGFGWKINYVPYLSLNTNGTLIYAAEMNGTVVAYRQTNSSVNVWVPTTQDNPNLDNNSSAGIGSVANLFNNVLRLSNINGTNTYKLTGADGSVRTFITNSFAIGSFTRQRPYLTTWADNRSNSYSFSYGTSSTLPDYGQLNRIQCTSGSYLGFYYDVYGHIIQAYTGDGRILQYTYDKFGDLVTVTLPDQSQVNYVYQHANMVTNSVTNLYSTHLLLQELKPNGRIVQNAYDSQRRVTNQMSTVGLDLNPIRTATFVYSNNFSLSSPTNQLWGNTWIYDYTNQVTTYSYTNGLIQKIVDPLNQSITQTWYGAATNGGYPRSLKSVTDKRGLTTAYQYDSYGNVNVKTLSGDLTGTNNGMDTATWHYTFYTNNLMPEYITEPNGKSTYISYDSVYIYLPAWSSHYTSGGNIYAFEVFNYTSVTNATATSYGLLQFEWHDCSHTTWNGTDQSTNWSMTGYGYNANGFLTSKTNYANTLSLPPAFAPIPSSGDLITTYVHNERGELIQQTDAAGRSTTFAYDDMGRPTARETFEAGQTMPMDWTYSYYNENGELVWTDGARYNPEDYVWRDYDGDGRKIQEIHWRSQANTDGSGVSAVPGYNLYSTSFYQYDPLGDLTQATDPLGNYVIQAYDAIGQLTQQTYYGSNGVALATNYFAHEPGGLVSVSTNALGGVTSNLYTSTGKLKFQQKPDGSTHSWAFDLTGRVVKETLANGNYWQTIYNDGQNFTTNIFYNSVGSLETNITQKDMMGNVITSIDALGNTWTNTYDGLNRILVAAGPATITVANVGLLPGTNFVTNVLQEITAYIYDNCGKVTTVSNALGETTVTTKDAIGRAVQVAIYNSNNVTPVRITSTYYSPDHNSVTVTNGSGANAIVTTTYTDTQGNPLLAIGYPTNGVTEFTWWQYDMAGNKIAQAQCSSNSSGITIWATNGWTYDGLNRVVTETSKDGATTTNSYDALGDVTSKVMPGGLTWSATYLNDGRISTEQESGGSLTARSMTYSYYGTGSPFVGKLQTVTDGRGTTRSNSYDDFLRVATVTTTGGTAQQQTSTSYQYDLRNMLTNLSQSFASTNTGPSTTLTRSYDQYGHILKENVSVAGGLLCSMGQTWDAAGRRSQLNGVPYNHQADGQMIASDGSVFAYANNGLLTARTNANRVYLVNQRDGKGRVLQTTTLVGISTALSETLTWRNDGCLANYIGARGDFTDTRNYTYSPLAQRVTQESFNVASGQTLTNNYTIDNGATGGLGILTSKAESGTATATWSVPSSGGLDGLSRVSQSQNTLINRPAYGSAVGAGIVTASLDGNQVNVQFNGSSNGLWRANLEMSSGSHTLSVSAVDPSGLFSGSSNSTFTVASGAADTVTNSYDANGNITQRVWINNLGQTSRVDTLTWDAFDRLIQISQRDTNSSGFDFVSIYDGLGRRVRTVETFVTNGVPITTPASSISTVDSWYDPQVEFLETAVSVNGIVTVKTYGPDVNGTYGGMQGVGGLESLYRTDHFKALGAVQDYFGNVIGTITNGTTVSWNPARFSSYGPVPGYQPLTLSLDIPLEQAVGWHGWRMDPDGCYHIGKRRYSPIEGRFLSADPLGHAASLDLYSYCGGDPVNHVDADGRLRSSYWTTMDPNSTSVMYNWIDGMVSDTANMGERAINGVVQAGAIGSDMIGQSAASMFGYGEYYQGYSQLYQNIYNNPSSGPTAGQILAGTAKTEVNIFSLGSYGIYQGLNNGVQTGDWSQAQDAFAFSALSWSGVRGMQAQGVNPWSASYLPNATDQAIISFFKTDPSGAANPTSLDPNTINFSQRTVSANVQQYTDDMANGNWDWSKSGPLRVMQQDDQWVSYDNRRLMAAQNAGLDSVPVQVVQPTDLAPNGMTWGDAFSTRFNHPWNVQAGGPVPFGGLSVQPTVFVKTAN